MSYLTRITCNTNGWSYPSGPICKCPNLYESLAGFGWDEWLFNKRNQNNGYQYGFLECFNKQPLNQEQYYDDVYLYVRCCGLTQNCYSVRIKIKHLVKLSKIEADEIQNHFTENGNIALMQDECPNLEYFQQGPTYHIFNVKFKMEDVFFGKSNCFTPPTYRFVMTNLSKPENSSKPRYIDTFKTMEQTQFMPINNIENRNNYDCLKDSSNKK